MVLTVSAGVGATVLPQRVEPLAPPVFLFTLGDRLAFQRETGEQLRQSEDR